jgi:uracil-DNA glycosylase
LMDTGPRKKTPPPRRSPPELDPIPYRRDPRRPAACTAVHRVAAARGKRRIHKRPNAPEVEQCRWWLNREPASIKPDLIVALGATAARSLSGRAVSVTKERGLMQVGHGRGFTTVHPFYLLRLPTGQDKADEYRRLVDDLQQVRVMLAEGRAAA